MRDAIVIGSGISGLGAALQLARSGQSVTLLEAGDRPGGLIKPWVSGDWSFDIGLQYVGQAGPGETFPRFLDQLGVDVAFREFAPDCLEAYDLPSFSSRLVRGREAQEALFVRDFPAEAAGLRWFFDTVHALDVIVGGVVGERRTPLRPWTTLVRAPDLLRAMRTDIVTFVSGRIRDRHLITALACFIGDIAMPPRRASAISVLIDWAHFLRGAWYPVGGGGGLVDGFSRAMAPLDVDVRTRAEVVRIQPGAPLTVTLADGEVIQAWTVICAVDATVTLRWVDAPLRPTLKHKVDTFRPSLSAYGAFLGVDLDLRTLGLSEANLWRYEHDDPDTLFAPLLRGEEPEHLALYFCSPSLKDPTTARAPAGHQALMVLAWAPTTLDTGPGAPPERDPSLEAARAERVVAAAIREFPSLRGHITFRHDVNPATFWQHARARQGGFYASEMSPEQSLPRRFSPWTGIPGLFLAGASVFGCGVLPGLLSGRIAATLAQRSAPRRLLR